MNSVVAEWLRPWEFVSRVSCWMGQSDVFGAYGKENGKRLRFCGHRGRCPSMVDCGVLNLGGTSSRCPRVGKTPPRLTTEAPVLRGLDRKIGECGGVRGW